MLKSAAGVGAADRRRDVRARRGSEADYKAAYAAAEAANKEAGGLRNQWTTTAATLAAAKKAADAGDFDKAVESAEGSRSAGKSFDLPGHQRERSSGRIWKYAEPDVMFARVARRHRMTIRRRDFVTLAGAAALSGELPRLARSADTPASTISNASAMRASCT